MVFCQNERLGSIRRIAAAQICLMILAGTPPTTVFAATSFVTTAPAATTALSPEPVVERGEDHVVSDLAPVADRHAPVVLEMAAGVDKDILAEGDVLPEIRIERRKDPQRLRHPAAEQLGEQRTHLLGRMVGRVQAERDAARLVAHLVHEAVDLLRVEAPARLYVGLEFFDRHGFAVLRFLYSFFFRRFALRMAPRGHVPQNGHFVLLQTEGFGTPVGHPAAGLFKEPPHHALRRRSVTFGEVAHDFIVTDRFGNFRVPGHRKGLFLLQKYEGSAGKTCR